MTLLKKPFDVQNWLIDYAWLCHHMGIKPRTVCECGVGPADISIAPSFVGKCDRMLLIEPLERQAEAIEKITGHPVLRVAIGHKSGEAKFIDNGGSSYLKGAWSPTPIDETLFITVPTVTFDTLDDGQVDVLNLDCEGQEWAVLKNMRSRPILLGIELWKGHPYANEIKWWFDCNNYTVRFTTGPTSETLLYSRGDWEPFHY